MNLYLLTSGLLGAATNCSLLWADPPMRAFLPHLGKYQLHHTLMFEGFAAVAKNKSAFGYDAVHSNKYVS